MNIVAVIMLFGDSIPSILRKVLAVPNVALMGCRVFKDTILFEKIRVTDFYDHPTQTESKIPWQGELAVRRSKREMQVQVMQ